MADCIQHPTQKKQRLLLSLKTWPDVDTSNHSLAPLINKIQSQRGNDFKGLNEKTLRDEIEELAGNDSESMAFEDGGDARAQKIDLSRNGKLPRNEAPRKSLAARRNELINNIEQARHESVIALDFVSLLLSSTRPIVAEISMSKQLKDNIPMGTLGAETIRSRSLDQIADLKLVQGWKAEALESASDLLLYAASRLTSEVERETRYWDEILRIKHAGWAISRVPRDPKTLRVKYGFAEAGADYKDPGPGALLKSSDGTIFIEVDHNVMFGRAVQLHIIRAGDITGSSRSISSKEISNSVTDMIERVRNSVYESELFFEIAREARTLANLGVRTTEDTVAIDFGNELSMQLGIYKSDADNSSITSNGSDDDLARGISIGLRVLLSHAHGQNLRRRCDPPTPISQRKPPNLPLQILRPIAAHLHHQEQLSYFNLFLDSLTSLPRSAGLFSRFASKRCVNCFAADNIPDVDLAVGTFLGKLESDAMVFLPGDWKVTINISTFLGSPIFGNGFTVQTSHDGSCATIMGTTNFGSFPEIKQYLQWCVERSIVNEIQGMKLHWIQVSAGNELSKAGERGQYKRLRVEVEGNSFSVKWNSGAGRDESYTWEGAKGSKTLLQVLQDI